MKPDRAVRKRVGGRLGYKRIKQRGEAMSNCEKCSFRARYDRNPNSILGRIWKWHIGWCPGWKSYLKSLPEEKRRKVAKQYR
jgi:hypothetical protein